MYNAPTLGRYNCQGFPIPFRGHGFPGQRSLGDFSVSDLLGDVSAPTNTFSVNTTLVYVALGLVGVAALLHYTGKGRRKYKAYSRRKSARAARKKALQEELAKL
jgi:hypothetical protein